MEIVNRSNIGGGFWEGHHRDKKCRFKGGTNVGDVEGEDVLMQDSVVAANAILYEVVGVAAVGLSFSAFMAEFCLAKFGSFRLRPWP
ncbi:hypothetical protein L6452_37270 [Arctium lappa]|uniref:Uncharacterized protein n=1 Tax=Arctium lappa TaxID=4217 RepID=A0ACB8Y313_ARCLA|nr:hypothetical protein L6452_37270 [Arctium lappa]